MTAVLERATATADRSARGAAWLAIVAVLVGLLLAPPLIPGPVLGAVAELLQGRVDALRGGTWTPLQVGDDIRDGELLRATDGPATLGLPDGRLSLAHGTRVVVERQEAILEDGAVLADTDRLFTVTSGAATARGRGVFRVDAVPAPRVGVYRGGAAVGLDGGERAAAAYEQIDLVEGVLGTAIPLRYVATDPWDERLLAEAIAVDDQVERLTASLNAVYGRALQPPGFYHDFFVVDDVLGEALPGLAPARSGDRYGPPAETLIAVVVTDLLATRSALGTEQAVAEIAALRRDGATWGIVLRRRDLGAADLREAADRALRSRATAVTDGSATAVTGAEAGATGDTSDAADPGAAPPPSDGPEPTTPPSGGGEDGPDGDGSGDDGGGGGGDGDGTVVDELTDDVGDVVDDTADDVGQLLEDPVGGVEDAVDDVTDIVEDTVDELPLPEPPGVTDPLLGA